MKLNVKNDHKGFTLVEIMIVVAIIALLAAIAVPNFLRARQRSQATRVLDELRLVDSAIDQYAIENNKKSGDSVNWDDIQKYLKAGTTLANSGGKDSIGNTFTYSTVGAGVKVSAATKTEFEEVADTTFWGVFDPGASTGT